MIKETFLPMRFLETERYQFLAEHGPQRVHPPNQSYPLLRQDYKEMCMIGHNYITTDCYVTFFSTLREKTKHLLDFRSRKQRVMFVSIERYEIKRLHILEKQFESRGSARI
jgi:hypothetical protein